MMVAADADPPLATLALVPVETDFSRTLDPARYENRNDRGGSSIGTFVTIQSCDTPEATETCDTGGGGKIGKVL